MADVFDADVERRDVANGAALGAALRAAQACEGGAWTDRVAPFSRAETTVTPRADTRADYDNAFARYKAFEQRVLAEQA